jgi:hypothetical protein
MLEPNVLFDDSEYKALVGSVALTSAMLHFKVNATSLRLFQSCLRDWASLHLESDSAPL